MQNKEELGKKAYSLGHSYYLDKGGCPQCVLLAVRDTIGYVTDDLIKASYTLSGGSGLLGKGTCGALNGGLLAIGSKFGRDLREAINTNPKISFELSKELIELHEKELGSFTCHGFQKKCHGRTFDMWKAEERKLLKSEKFINNCAHITGKVAQWCVEMMI